MKYEKAMGTTSQTLVGYSKGKFPQKSGNCFSVRTDQGNEYRIVNFNVENWDEMIRMGLELPIVIGVLDEGTAIIQDDRIPDEWYDDQYCSVCCAEKHWPINQKLAKERQVSRGEVEIRGYVITNMKLRHESFPLFYTKPEADPMEGWTYNLSYKTEHMVGVDL